jgi:lipopolysaccharide/colanic/teichoic acid biosynthesis glycosyltransferase
LIESHRLSALPPIEAAVVSERLRADRTGVPFCAVTFQPPLGTRRGSVLEAGETATGILLRALEKRIRATDVIGRVAPCGIGVVLPHTPPDGALVFARAIVAEAHTSGLETTYRIYSYPHRPPGHQPRDAEGHSQPRERTANTTHENNGGEPTVGLKDVGSAEDLLPGFKAPLWKRGLDMFGAVVGIVCFAPLLIALAAYIKVVSRGPVLIRQERIGLQGRLFRMWKLRTMHQNADDGVHKKHVLAMIAQHGDAEGAMRKLDSADPRIIPGGLWLRRSSIDELPQLVNVLLGEMSLVGPRPEMPYAFEAYDPWHTRRFDVLPGMTGLWQVSGKNHTTFREMIRLDINYGRALMPARDIAILTRTLPVVLGAANEGWRHKSGNAVTQRSALGFGRPPWVSPVILQDERDGSA